jgi:hypothetical protein
LTALAQFPDDPYMITDRRVATTAVAGSQVVEVEVPPQSTMEVVATTVLYDVSGIFWQGRMHSSFSDGSSEDNQVSGTLSGVVAGEITIKNVERDLEGRIVGTTSSDFMR